ncbi:MAG TPA: LA2681 family HEPN domain-containing protein [Terriglobales bacterium]|jgi:tetratricopeptide (TPR) repeat protein
MKKKPSGLKLFEEVTARLHGLVDEDPIRAIQEASALSSDKPVGGIFLTSLKASILVDAGSCAKDKQAIEDGIRLFKELLAKNPKQADFQYNIGNGFIALADQENYGGCDWYLTTATTRRDARNHFQQAISSENNDSILSIALTNLGNALAKAHRWVEAYDAYTKALECDASNAVAATGAAKILLCCIARGIGNKQVLQSVAARHLDSARLHPQRLAELAGARAQQALSKLLQKRVQGGKPPNLSKATAYEKFVARHRLALSPTIEGLDTSLKRWDSLRFNWITEPAAVNAGIPPLFAMLNVIKSDFLAARHLAYQALCGEFPESGFYSDTLDYAVYGIVPSLLSLAQRACIDVLDKIAVATTEYFCIPSPAKYVYFSNRWFESSKKDQPLAWHPSLRPHIDKGNTALIALSEISLDVGEGGSQHRKKAYRHSSTHRFTVLHDIGCHPSRESGYIEHSKMIEFKAQLIESLQLVRATILYFVEMISINESVNATSQTKKLSIGIPSHHHIRGHDTER